MIKNITPQKAWEYLQTDHNTVLLDVRSTQEFQFVGHPLGALNIPLKEPPKWQILENFVEQINTVLGNFPSVKEYRILIICRSGQRSKEAAELLIKDGYTSVYNIDEGFEGDRDDKGHRNKINGWRFNNLPWEQS